MERRHVVIKGQSIRAGLHGRLAGAEPRVAASFQHNHTLTASASRAATVPPPAPEPTTM